ncbi:hypothetical protein TraAM80_07181 [Trypanosoma rangeli]|uniref:Uncharacterized protein n=1 Tax=Trypanosoma rangeli TaxID=5698 RepID=A0A3R7KTM3_TRYRA|nr:uncharacterized protein TraAM80_07181 [Trypanosoma rangeli]RNF01129.1 hypothetical protein TraAM80_07181 [Trypanosoma rangeli]|eukprot:RNF01129.1 hypothetical protein TraAM80_07181 [Trypanosoma rangeli]
MRRRISHCVAASSCWRRLRSALRWTPLTHASCQGCGSHSIRAAAPLRLHSTSTAAPVWQRIVASIQEAVEKVDDMESWWRFCRLWRTHFPQAAPDVLPQVLEDELLLCGKQDGADEGEEKNNATERVPHDLHCLPVFLQALCAAVQLGEARLRMSASVTESGTNAENAFLLAVLAELRVVAFYLAQERLPHTLHAAHDRLAEAAHTRAENSTKDIVLRSAPFCSRDAERVCQMGVRLTPEELQQAVVLAETSAALLALSPPVALLPSLYRLLLPALGACEQLENRQLGALATAIARGADFDDPNGSKDVSACPATAQTADPSSEALRPTMTSYTVLSHLHAVACALEGRMRESMQRRGSAGREPDHFSVRQAQLRLVSLKQRKEFEKQRAMERARVGGGAVDMVPLETVGVVCSALAARRYADGHFWKAVTDYTVVSLQAAVSSSSSSSPPSSSALHPDLVQDVRDILFALDHVHHTAHFDCVMSLLVKLRLLEKPIPPPSSLRNAMKAVKGRTAEAFDR